MNRGKKREIKKGKGGMDNMKKNIDENPEPKRYSEEWWQENMIFPYSRWRMCKRQRGGKTQND